MPGAPHGRFRTAKAECPANAWFGNPSNWPTLCAHDASAIAGNLCPAWAEELNLTAGIPIAIGEMGVHYGAIGCGVDEGTLVKVIGTSTCDCAVVSADIRSVVHTHSRSASQLDSISC